MTSYLARSVAPESDPVSLSDLKDFCEITHSLKDADLTDALAAARDETEIYTGLALMTQTWVLSVNAWCERAVELARAPLASVVSVKYYPADGGAQVTVSSGQYRVAPCGFTRFGFVEFADTFDFPALAYRWDAVEIVFTAGVESSTIIPPSLIRAIKILARDLMDEKRNIITGTIVAENPHLRNLFDPHRVRGVVA